MIEKIPKISIIVPVYNVEDYIEKCIKSILNQVFTEFELILVDDGSTDNSGNICDKYAEKDNRIIVIHKENGGISSARNIGLNIAKGEYIAFVDSDDYINKNMYHTLYNLIIKTQSDIAMCNYKTISKDEEVNLNEDQIINSHDIKCINNIQYLNNLYGKDKVKYIVMWNKLYKNEIFRKLRFKDSRIEEDEFIIHHVLYLSDKIVYIDKNYYYYYMQRNNSIVGSKYNLKRLDKIYALEDRIEFFKEKKLVDLYNKAVKDYIDVFFWNYYEMKKEINGYKKEIKNIMKSYNKVLKDMLFNPFISLKHKLFLILFKINLFK